MNFSLFCETFILLNTIFLSDASSVNSQDIDSVVARLVAQNEALTDRICRIENELRQEKAKNVLLTHNVEKLEARLDQNEDAVQQALENKRPIRQLNTATCAFTAVISPADLSHLQAGQPIIFDRTITNMGNAYDTSTGVFTAPIRGVYMFNMDVMVESGENEYLEFVKDGNHVMYNYIHARGGLDNVSSSRAVIIELERGNQLWIRTTQSSTHGSGNIHGNEFSTFSGWLLAITE